MTTLDIKQWVTSIIIKDLRDYKPRDINAKLKIFISWFHLQYFLAVQHIQRYALTTSICPVPPNLRPYIPHIYESITYLIGSSLAWADPYIKNLTHPTPPIHPLTPPGQQLLWASRRQISEPTLNLGQLKLQERCNKTNDLIKSRSRCKPPVNNIQHPPKLQLRTYRTLMIFTI